MIFTALTLIVASNDIFNNYLRYEWLVTVVFTTVVVTVKTAFFVTNRLDTVTEDVSPDIPMPHVAKVNKTKTVQHNCYLEFRD